MRLRLLACLGMTLLVPEVAAQEWTRFRGPNGSGVVRADLALMWSEKDFAWKTPLAGSGHSSPVLWGDRLFVTSADPSAGQRIVQCLDADDGKELWSRGFPAAKHRQHEHNSWASATPAVDERHVYLAFASPKDYLVVALDHAGKESWRVDLGGFQSGHGFGVSPIVHDDLVIVAHEHEGKSAIVALDRLTGKERWRLPRRSRTTYSTPCVFAPKAPNGRPAELILVSYEHGITSVAPATGKVNWETDVFAKKHIETSIASPIVAGDLVIGSSGWLGVRQEVIAVRLPLGPAEKGAEGEGRPTPTTVYTLTKSAPLVPTPLVCDDLLYLWNDDGVVTCCDVATGKTHWRERVPGEYYSSPIAVADHVLNVSRDGDVVVLKAARQFDHVATSRLGEGSHSTPAVARGMVYFRTFRHVIAVR